MKKPMLVLAALVAILFFGSLTMYIFQLCPPKGPWPVPPWCVGQAYIPFHYRELDYINERFEPTNKSLDFIIGTFDTWLSPHFINLGDNPKDHVETTMKKLGEIGSEGLFLTDFVMLSKGPGVKKMLFGLGAMSQSEMSKVVSEARKNGQRKIILIVNLADIEAPQRRHKGKGMEGTASEKLWSNQSLENWKKVFEGWEEHILKEAKKAESSRIDYLIINPGDFTFANHFENKSYLNTLYIKWANAVRELYDGKVGLLVFYKNIPDISPQTLGKVDFVVVSWDPNEDYKIKELFKNAKEDVNDIERSFTQWLSSSYWERLKGKEVYLAITMPSYDGALQNGWIEGIEPKCAEYKRDYKEQALAYEGLFRSLYKNNFNIKGVISYGYWWTDRIYPEMPVIRNDLTHSIRNKDAENVFYKWSKIFR